MIKRIIVDGNDGTGKTYRIEKMKELFPNIVFEDRGIFSEMTLQDIIFTSTSINSKELIATFYYKIKEDTETLYIICDCSIETSQKRILERGDSLKEKYHTEEDLKMYKERFFKLVNAVKDLPNVMFVKTD